MTLSMLQNMCLLAAEQPGPSYGLLSLRLMHHSTCSRSSKLGTAWKRCRLTQLPPGGWSSMRRLCGGPALCLCYPVQAATKYIRRMVTCCPASAAIHMH